MMSRGHRIRVIIPQGAHRWPARCPVTGHVQTRWLWPPVALAPVTRRL
ncbi:hypothetical protein [Plesiomonas shigelloides]